MNFAVSDCSLCIKDDNVYKIGGKVDDFSSSNYIEKLNFTINKWETVAYDSPDIDPAFLRMPYKAGSYFLNNDIILFGGFVHEVRNNGTLKLSMSKEKPVLEEWASTPFAGSIISPVIDY